MYSCNKEPQNKDKPNFKIKEWKDIGSSEFIRRKKTNNVAIIILKIDNPDVYIAPVVVSSMIYGLIGSEELEPILKIEIMKRKSKFDNSYEEASLYFHKYLTEKDKDVLYWPYQYKTDKMVFNGQANYDKIVLNGLNKAVYHQSKYLVNKIKDEKNKVKFAEIVERRFAKTNEEYTFLNQKIKKSRKSSEHQILKKIFDYSQAKVLGNPKLDY